MGSLPGSRPSDLTAPLLADVGADDAGTQTTKVSHLAALRAGAMLGQMCERSLIEHQLSACYFAFHNFWVFFIPLNLLIAAGSILAFVGDPDSGIISDNSFINVNIIVGCIGALSVFWSSIDRLLNYKSRTDMHEAAKQLCKDLLLDLDFALLQFQSLSEEERTSSDANPFDEQSLSDIKAKLDHVQLSCTSSIPDAVTQSFKRLNTMVTYNLNINSLDKADRDDVQILRIANVLLCNEITKSWLWPMKLPGAAVTTSAQDKLTKVMKEKKEKAAQTINDAAPRPPGDM